MLRYLAIATNRADLTNTSSVRSHAPRSGWLRLCHHSLQPDTFGCGGQYRRHTPGRRSPADMVSETGGTDSFGRCLPEACRTYPVLVERPSAVDICSVGLRRPWTRTEIHPYASPK